jgi:hypothetical protein
VHRTAAALAGSCRPQTVPAGAQQEDPACDHNSTTASQESVSLRQCFVIACRPHASTAPCKLTPHCMLLSSTNSTSWRYSKYGQPTFRRWFTLHAKAFSFAQMCAQPVWCMPSKMVNGLRVTQPLKKSPTCYHGN